MFVVTEQAMAELEKGRKRRERERMGQVEDCEPASGAHAAAEGWRDAMEAEQGHRDGALKASAYTDSREGPGHPMQPGEISAQDYTRGYLDQGHAADSLSNSAGHHAAPVPHIDLTASRGHLTFINPTAPMGPGGHQ
jgi:hypothetical protein